MPAQEITHQPIFKGVEADYRKASAGSEQAQRLREAALELPQFLVHPHAQRLEGARGWILARFALWHGARDQRRQLRGARQWFALARATYRLGDASREAGMLMCRCVSATRST